MAKKSRRRPLRSEKDQAGCISGLIRIFDFRNGRSTRKLLSDRRRGNKQAVGSSNAKLMLTDSDIGFQETKVDTDSGMTSVKKLMEGEMYDDGSVQEEGIEKRYPECMHTRQGRRRNSKNSNKACKRCNEIINLIDLEAEKNLGSDDKSFDQLVSKNTSDGFDFEIIMHLLHDDINQHSGQVSAVDKGKLTAAIKIFIDQSSSGSKRFLENGQIQDSEDFRDALQRLSSNRDLILKLLEGSQLRENLRSNSLPRSGFLGEKVDHSKTDELIGHKPTRNFFRKRSKSQEHFPSTGTENNRHSSKIVILKPRPMEVGVNPAIQDERSHFSFTDFKRKLKNAVTKRHDSDKGGAGDNSGWRSPNRNHFYVEKFTKPPKKVAKAIVSEEVLATEKSDKTMPPGVSNIYLEAKKHLVEMLNSGDHSAELKSQQLPRSLGRILSFSEYYHSPMYSPRKASPEILVTGERTPSPRNSIEIVNEGTDQSLQENLHNSEIKLGSTDIIPDEKLDYAKADGNLPIECSDAKFDEKTRPSGLEESQNDNQEDYEIHLSQSCSSDSKEDGQSGNCDEVVLEDSNKQSSKMETCDDCQALSSPPSSPSSSKTLVSVKVEDLEVAADRTERPSPVSVLEPLYTEDDISPARAISRTVEVEIQPRKIHFEECVQTSIEDEESAFEYVEAVLLGSGLDWDEYLLRWLSSSTILEPPLYDDVELFSSRSHHEQKLLFDCTNEVLEEVCEHYFGSFPMASPAKNNLRPVPLRMDLINEIWEGVEGRLLQHPSPQSLDRLLKKDMARCRKWMNLQSDIKLIGAEVGETILDNMMEETILAFLTSAAELEVLEQPFSSASVN